MRTIEGYVDRIIFQNEENGYTVMSLTVDGEELCCVGICPMLSVGDHIEAEGEDGVHARYGPQFRISSFTEKKPEDEAAIERYLASGVIKGIGSALAARIVKRFKKDTFRILEEEPERLSEIKGISEHKAMEISDQVNEKKDLRESMLFLQQYGINMNLAVKIYQTYGQEIYTILRENPYRLAEDIEGIGFQTADEIAAKVGILVDSDYRIRSGVLYALQQATQEGHTYLPLEELIARAAELLGVEGEHTHTQITNLAMERKLIMREAGEVMQIYSAPFYYMEANTAALLRELNVSYDETPSRMEKRIRAIEKATGTSLDEQQLLAVQEAIRHGLTVITGGPGTGKTTTINTLLKYFEAEDMEIFLAAPTGRAAKRMTEATGYEARTIHRMLEVSGGEDGIGGFARNEQNPLETDVVIVDEMSMVDIGLMYALLKAIAPGTRLILVGDVDQLPSVGPGCVLRDIIESEQFPTVHLTKIFRQAETSDIVVNAHKINHGEAISLDNQSEDFFFLRRYEADAIIKETVGLVTQRLPKYVGAECFDIQVLTPMRRGILGVENLNKVLQEQLNPPEPSKREKEFRGVFFRVGDKVMQTKNDYQLEWEIQNRYGIAVEKGCGIFNGDMGVITEINDYADSMTISFDEGRVVEYPYKQLEELELAYAVTVHKSQGSEYPAVVIPLLQWPQPLMSRNIIYTAVTRAKKCVTIVGDEKKFAFMVQNNLQKKRYSGLKDRLTERL